MAGRNSMATGDRPEWVMSVALAMQSRSWVVLLLLIALATGCADSAQHAATRSASPTATSSAPPPPPPPPPAHTQGTSESTHGADSSDPAIGDGSAAPIAASSQQDDQQQDDQPAAARTERVVAEPGVGIQGRSLDKFDGIIVRPAKEYFSFREKAVFQIQIPHAMQLFQATEGRGPMSHEEFMEKIVGANQIALPQLPPDFRYVFDPQEQELMVERPRTQ